MEISFYPQKDERTRKKRGFSLALGAEVIRNQVATRIDNRQDYGEERLIAWSPMAMSVSVSMCVYMLRDEMLRIISLRKANDRETARYGR